MTQEQYVERFHQLVEDFTNRRLSTVDYRIQRRQLLAEIDTYFNGTQPMPSVSDELRTQPNPKRTLT